MRTRSDETPDYALIHGSEKEPETFSLLDIHFLIN